MLKEVLAGKYTQAMGAIAKLTNMVANIIGWGAITYKLGAALVAGTLSAATGVGAVVALLAGIGMAWSVCMCVLNSVTTIMAFCYFGQDNGFKVKEFSLFGFGICLVAKL